MSSCLAIVAWDVPIALRALTRSTMDWSTPGPLSAGTLNRYSPLWVGNHGQLHFLFSTTASLVEPSLVMNLSTIADGEAIIEITLVEYPSPTTFTSIHCYTPLRKITNMSPKTITAENQPNANIATAPIVPPLFVHSSKMGGGCLRVHN